MLESFRKPKLTIEQQAIKQATDEADPTTYSTLPPEEKLHSEGKEKISGNKIVSDDSSRYFEVTKNPQQQQALARMAKGILNVSDVVDVTDRKLNKQYYSREMPLERVEKETPPREILADVFILDAVFGNADRSYSDQKTNNVHVGRERAVYFDFQGAVIDEDPFGDSWKEKLTKLDPGAMNIATEKLHALRERFVGEQGLNFLNVIVQASGKTAWKLFAPHDKGYTGNDLQKNLLLRIDNALTEITARQRKDGEVAATVDLPRV